MATTYLFLTFIFLVLSFVILLTVVNWRLAKVTASHKRLEAKYQGVADAQAEVTRLEALAATQREDINTLRSDYAGKRALLDRLQRQIAVFDDNLAFAEMGVYEPHFEFDDSEGYKASIATTRDEQKRLITAKKAVICTAQWHVDGSLSKGATMTNRNIRLTLRAFNGECDAAIANTRWNNANAMEKRILTVREQIDNLNASNKIFVTADYLNLKLRELYLTHEYREKLKAEKDERAEMARQAREEQRLLRDLEQAQDDEARYEKLLSKARTEAATIVGDRLNAFTEQIRILERDLANAHAKVARAQAMAEKTRSGYVYIISNVGSFGEGVVKIGLTRRLDPSDRVRELGDASVPFLFDTHAMIYSDDAPALEHALHAEFEQVRVNTSNYRKEFFRAAISDVEIAVRRLAPTASFFRDIEAQEYQETLSRRQAQLVQNAPTEVDLLPESI